jgi:hypothetical protein
MISTLQLLYKLDLKLNKLSTNQHQQVALEDKILALNEAQTKLIKRKLGTNNPSQTGFDGSKKRYEDLQNLIEPYQKLTPTLSDPRLNAWTVPLSDLEPNYMFYVDSYITADKDACKNRLVAVTQVASHADVQLLLNNNNYKPSFEYQETFCTLSDNKQEIYTDGTFTPVGVYISYLRYPQKIDVEGYQDFDGQSSINQDSELADYLEDELLELTVLELGFSLENQSAVQGAVNKTQISE